MTGLPERIICTDLRKRRFGFVVFERSNRLLDWGTRELGMKTRKAGHAASVVEQLLSEWQPEKIILGAPSDNDGLPSGPARTAVLQACARLKLPVRHIRRKEMNALLGGANKHLTARMICARFPELGHRLADHARRIYETEPHSMTMFDAAALGLAYFRRKTRRALPTVQANH
jgi:hypothetical protein